MYDDNIITIIITLTSQLQVTWEAQRHCPLAALWCADLAHKAAVRGLRDLPGVRGLWNWGSDNDQPGVGEHGPRREAQLGDNVPPPWARHSTIVVVFLILLACW